MYLYTCYEVLSKSIKVIIDNKYDAVNILITRQNIVLQSVTNGISTSFITHDTT